MDTVKNYVEFMFSSLPKTPQAFQLKKNMLENLEEKYNDLIAGGKTSEQASAVIISQFGSVEDLKAELEQQTDGSTWTNGRETVHFSWKNGIHVEAEDGDVVHVGFDGVHVKEKGGDRVDVDGGGVRVNGYDYTHGKCQDDCQGECSSCEHTYTKDGKPLFPFAAILWPLCIISFLIAGVIFKAWHPAWLIFPVTVILNIIIDCVQRRASGWDVFSGIMWICAVVVYLLLGFTANLWHPGWIIFPVLGLAQGAISSIGAYYKHKNKNKE